MPTRQGFKNLAQKFVDSTFADFTQTFTIESETETPDGQGGAGVAWSTFATITGFVTPESGNESSADDQLKTDQSYKFSFEYVAGITTKMRINYGGEFYNIRSIESVKDHDIWINIMGDKGKVS